MPRPQIDLEPFRIEIEQRCNQNHTQEQIRSWLASEGISVSKNTLSARIVAWGASRHAQTDDANPELLAAIELQFHSTYQNDQDIATAIIAQGVHTTSNQVRRLRMIHGWRRRNDGNDMIQAREETFARVQAALNESTCRSYGRELLQTSLRLNGYIAQENNIRDAL